MITNAYQAPFKYVATDGKKWRKQISRTGSHDKRSITLTLCESHNRTILPFQFIYKGKTARSLPNTDFPDSFSLSHSEKHWSNETETILLINDVLVPYMKRVKEEKALPRGQKSLLIWVRSRHNQLQKLKTPCKLWHRNSHGTKKHDLFATATRSHHK